MARLVNDSGILGDKLIDLSDTKTIGLELQEVGFAKITEAIHIIQTEMGIADTTAEEAGSTIQGSVGMMKAAWQNLVTGIADENANLDVLMTNFVDSLGTVAENLIPKIEVALGSIASLIKKVVPIIVKSLPSIVSSIIPTLHSSATDMVNAVIEVLPDLLNTVVESLLENAPLFIEAAIGLVNSLIQSIEDNAQILINGAISMVKTLANGILSMLPQIVQLGLNLIVSLANGIAESLPELIPTIVSVIVEIVNVLTDPENLSMLLDAALTLVTELAFGLVDAIPQLVDATLTIIENLVEFLTDPQNIGKLMTAALEIIIAIGTGLIKSIPRLLEFVVKIPASIAETILGTNWLQIGKDIVNGIWEGIKSVWNNLKNWFSNAWDSLVGGVKDLLGIHSPSRVFAGIGKNMALGVGEGWDDEFGDVEKDINGSMSFDDASLGVSSYSGGGLLGGIGGTSFGTVNINIDGANVQDDETLADMIAERLQRMTERRGAVFA